MDSLSEFLNFLVGLFGGFIIGCICMAYGWSESNHIWYKQGLEDGKKKNK